MYLPRCFQRLLQICCMWERIKANGSIIYRMIPRHTSFLDSWCTLGLDTNCTSDGGGFVLSLSSCKYNMDHDDCICFTRVNRTFTVTYKEIKPVF